MDVAKRLFEIRQLSGINVRWYLTGDLMFISRERGHLGPCSYYPCPLCLNRDMGSNEIVHMRTVSQINDDARVFLENCGDYSKAAKRTNMSKKCNSISETSLFQHIECSSIVPPSLHLIMGIFQSLFKV